MTTKEDIYHYIGWYQKHHQIEQNPIFEILLFSATNEKLIHSLSTLDVGTEDHPGFYYELNIAICALNENWGDIQDHAFYTGFILCHFPGLYECATTEARMYFIWDEKKQGFYQAEEPEIFRYYSL